MKTEEYTDPYSTPEYAQFVEEMAKHCRCTGRHPCPCDGVLAGGLCDNLGNGNDAEVDSYSSDDEDCD